MRNGALRTSEAVWSAVVLMADSLTTEERRKPAILFFIFLKKWPRHIGFFENIFRYVSASKSLNGSKSLKGGKGLPVGRIAEMADSS